MCEKMDVIDLEDDEIDAEVLNSMSVTQVRMTYDVASVCGSGWVCQAEGVHLFMHAR